MFQHGVIFYYSFSEISKLIMSVQMFGLNLFAISGLLIGVSSFVMALFVLTRGLKKLHILWSIFFRSHDLAC